MTPFLAKLKSGCRMLQNILLTGSSRWHSLKDSLDASSFDILLLRKQVQSFLQFICLTWLRSINHCLPSEKSYQIQTVLAHSVSGHEAASPGVVEVDDEDDLEVDLNFRMGLRSMR